MLVGHSGNAGDIIAHLPAVLACLKLQGQTACTYLLKVNQPASYMVKHPLGHTTLSTARHKSSSRYWRLSPTSAERLSGRGRP